MANRNDLPIDFFEVLSLSNRRRISDDLFISIRDAILNGKIPSGYTFPNENDMCKLLDVGRSTLREAYAQLETVNLITRSKNGTYVNEEARTINFMNLDKIAQFSDPKHIIQFREILELGTVKIAALIATAEDIAALNAIVDLMETEIRQKTVSPEVLTLMDFTFHHKLAEISGNALLAVTLDSIRLSYESFVFAVFTKMNLRSQSVEDHRNIIRAIKNNDPAEAETLMRSHLNHVAEVAVSGNE